MRPQYSSSSQKSWTQTCTNEGYNLKMKHFQVHTSFADFKNTHGMLLIQAKFSKGLSHQLEILQKAVRRMVLKFSVTSSINSSFTEIKSRPTPWAIGRRISFFPIGWHRIENVPRRVSNITYSGIYSSVLTTLLVLTSFPTIPLSAKLKQARLSL